ncbi:MAG: hypothetical protein JNM93_06435 [Bacteriovoracaceae bacterium]|nr:hypothetical protein [Bacteriovoracaceae bacterium]
MKFLFLFLSLNAYSLDPRTLPDFSNQLKGYDFHSVEDKKTHFVMQFINEKVSGPNQCYCVKVIEKGGQLSLYGGTEHQLVTENDFYSCGPCKED